MNEIVKKNFQGYIYFGKLQGKRMLFGSKVEASNFKDQLLTLLRAVFTTKSCRCLMRTVARRFEELKNIMN